MLLTPPRALIVSARQGVSIMNPFDDPDATFSVLVNEEEQHSLWPSHLPVPTGWRVTHGDDTRDACLAYVEENWTDLRPLSAR
jgi:MbtH protein